jgi:hypothetical protein
MILEKQRRLQILDKSTLDQLVEKLDVLIRQGEHGKARDILLTELGSLDLPRSYIFKFADLARRVNTAKTLVTILRPIVLNEVPGAAPATAAETALYATGLSRYDLSAIPKLRKFIAHSTPSTYLRWVGRTNLAACLISQLHWEEGQRVLADLREEITRTSDSEDPVNFRLLFANSLELSAQSAVMQGQLDLALEFIKRGEAYLQNTRSRYEILLKKWRVIVELMKAPRNPEALARYSELKSETVKARNWETWRDLEFYQALALRDDQLFIKIYHGSPYASYRKRLKDLYRPQFPIPRTFNWNLRDSESPKALERFFDLKLGRDSKAKAAESLLESPLLNNLLKILTHDFYRPLSIGALIAQLYEGEYYNPISSTEKALQAVKRLRKWFSENKIPMDIEQIDTTFRLVSTEPYAIRLSYRQEEVSKHSLILERLLTHYSNQIFTARELAAELEIPLTTAQSFLAWAIKSRKVKQLAAGRSARYRISSRF